MGMGVVLLFAPIVVLLTLGLAWVVVRSCTLPRGMGEAPSCGRCRYQVTSGERCPECGGAYREVGVLTPWLVMRMRPGLVAAGVCLAVLCLMLSGLLMALAGPVMRSRALVRDTLWAEYMPTSEPYSFALLMVAERDRRASGRTTSGEAKLMVVKPGTGTGPTVPLPPGPVLVVGLDRPELRLLDAGGAEVLRAPAGDAEAVRRLFELSGVDPGSTAVEGSRVDAVASLTQGLLVGGWPGLGNAARPAAPGALMQRGLSSGSRPLPLSAAEIAAPTVVAVLAGVAVFAVVLRWIASRRRRLLTPPASPPAVGA